MENRYRIEKVDQLTYKDKDWKRYFDFRTNSYALINQPMPFDTAKQLKELSLESIRLGQQIYQVWKNEQANGIFFFSIECENDLEKRFTSFNNYMNDRCLEINLLEMIIREFITYDETSNALAVLSKDGNNDQVLEVFGAYLGSNVELYELNVKEANLEKIDSWLAEAPAKFPNLRIEFYKNIPDELLEEFATVFTQLLRDMPAGSELGELKITAEGTKSVQEAWKIRNHVAYRYLIFNETNQLIAKTNVSLNLKRPQEMYQFMTGVTQKYRGQGLSKWLKAAMFKKLTTDFPELEKIKTDTHPNNHPSRELSKQMGYKRIGTKKEFLIDRANIVTYLNANS